MNLISKIFIKNLINHFMIKRLLLCLSILVCSFSCQKKSDSKNLEYAEVNGDKIPIIRLDLVEDSATTIPLSVIFDDVEIVPLETKPECLVGYFDNHMTDHSVLIAVRNYGAPIRLYEFGLDGRFIREIGGVGSGPGEHSGYMMSKLTSYPEDDLIMATFMGGPDEEHLFSYSGEFVKSITPPGDMFGGVLRFSDGIYMTGGNTTGVPKYKRDSFQLILSDSEGKWINSFPRKSYPPKDKIGYIYGGGGECLWRFNDTWKIWSPGDDTVYQVTKGALIPKAIFSLGQDFHKVNEFGEPQSVVGRFSIDDLHESQRFFHMTREVLYKLDAKEWAPGQWSSMLYLSYSHLIYDKEVRRAYNLRFEDDILGLLPVEKFPMHQTWDEFGVVYRIAQAVDVLDWIAEAKESNTVPEKTLERLIKLESSIDENSNPVMFIFKERSQERIGKNLEKYFK